MAAKEKIVFDENDLKPKPRKPVKKKKANGAKKVRTKATSEAVAGKKTKMAKKVAKGERLPPPVPEGKSLKEIQAMDPDDPAFKHPQGRPRKHQDTPDEELTWTELIRKQAQGVVNGKRAKVRKWEAEAVKATQEYSVVPADGRSDGALSKDIDAEEILVQEQILTLDDWDNEELIKGYRRGRNGKFGPPPKYIPRTILNECFKRLVKRGGNKLQAAYLEVIEGLVDMAGDENIPSKVRLDAMREILDRTVGKTPDHLKVQTEAPWENILMDSFEPIQLVERTETQIKRLKVGGELEDGDDIPGSFAAGSERPRALESSSSTTQGLNRPVIEQIDDPEIEDAQIVAESPF